MDHRPSDSTNGEPVPHPVPASGGRDEPQLLRRAADFDASYAGAPPWDIGRPQPAFLRLAQAGAIRGRVLDAGCGTGEHALMAAGLGLEATGVDVSQVAIGLAEGKARNRKLKAQFLVWDALGLPSLGNIFDTVLDSALFHVLDDDERPRYAESLRAVLAPGGCYFMLCFSDREPGDWGPRRVRQAEIRDCFATGWRIDSIENATISLALNPDSAFAWLSAITRL